jgi:hypothetical protein
VYQTTIDLKSIVYYARKLFYFGALLNMVQGMIRVRQWIRISQYFCALLTQHTIRIILYFSWFSQARWAQGSTAINQTTGLNGDNPTSMSMHVVSYNHLGFEPLSPDEFIYPNDLFDLDNSVSLYC